MKAKLILGENGFAILTMGNCKNLLIVSRRNTEVGCGSLFMRLRKISEEKEILNEVKNYCRFWKRVERFILEQW